MEYPYYPHYRSTSQVPIGLPKSSLHKDSAGTPGVGHTYCNIDNSEVTVLALLDVSAAFDSVDQNILLQRLRTSYGINSRALDCLESFVRERTQSVQIGILRSEWRLIGIGVGISARTSLTCSLYGECT